jgi:hypothetical protein
MSEEAEMKELMELPSFRKFLWRLIQTAGILSPGTNGTVGRDLNWIEGRRSLGFAALQDAERGIPEQARSPDCLLTLASLLREAAQSTPEPKRQRNDRSSDRYD